MALFVFGEHGIVFSYLGQFFHQASPMHPLIKSIKEKLIDPKPSFFPWVKFQKPVTSIFSFINRLKLQDNLILATYQYQIFWDSLRIEIRVKFESFLLVLDCNLHNSM